MATCQRCPAQVDTVAAMERHLREDHLMGARQAQAEARGGPPRPEPPRPEAPDHVCPTCKTEIPCDWRAVGHLKEQARRLATVAGIWEARLAGTPIGRPRRLRETFDVAHARRLVADGMTYTQVAELVGAPNKQAIHRAFKRLGQASS